ncbi:hypothetical protein EAE93_13595 [Photorhabdus akhurstii]|nr:hypothetical protein [Photorhabdus akhurstii]
METVELAKSAVPSSRKINGKALTGDVSLNAGDVGAQPVGNYAVHGEIYTKSESDDRYQPLGNYQPAGNYTVRGESYTKGESDGRYGVKNTANLSANGWWKCGNTGLIYQWGISVTGGVVKFPIPFKNKCFSVMTNIYYDRPVKGGDNQWPVFNLFTDSFQTQYKSAGWFFTWFAVGE